MEDSSLFPADEDNYTEVNFSTYYLLSKIQLNEDTYFQN